MADNRYAPYAKETAMCVDFAYGSVVDDLQAELRTATGPTEQALKRLLKKIEDRRAVMEAFTRATKAA